MDLCTGRATSTSSKSPSALGMQQYRQQGLVHPPATKLPSVARPSCCSASKGLCSHWPQPCQGVPSSLWPLSRLRPLGKTLTLDLPSHGSSLWVFGDREHPLFRHEMVDAGRGGMKQAKPPGWEDAQRKGAGGWGGGGVLHLPCPGLSVHHGPRRLHCENKLQGLCRATSL